MSDTVQISVAIRPSFESVIEKYNFPEQVAKRIGSAAINRSLATLRSHIVKRLANDINLRQRDIRENVVTLKANPNVLKGSVDITRKTIPLYDFIGTRQTKDGVSVQVLKNGPRSVLHGTFIAQMKSGHRGVFEREFVKNVLGPQGRHLYETGASKRLRVGAEDTSFEGPRVGRLPIYERFGLTLTGYLSHAPAVVQEEQETGRDILMKNILSQIQRRLAGTGAVIV